MQELAQNPTTAQVFISDSDILRCIQAQAHAAFSKSNRNSGIEVEDFVSIGWEVFEKAKKTWAADKGTKFTTYFTTLLQRTFYHEMAKTHRKKRGGAGNKKEEMNHKRYSEEKRAAAKERWESGEAEKDVVQQISIDVHDHDEHSGPAIQIAAKDDDTVDFELLIEQVGKYIPKSSLPVFKQMVDPDPELCRMAYEASVGKKECTVDKKLMADYLQIPLNDLKLHITRIQNIVANRLGVRV